jgi:hypothetical protein
MRVAGRLGHMALVMASPIIVAVGVGILIAKMVAWGWSMYFSYKASVNKLIQNSCVHRVEDGVDWCISLGRQFTFMSLDYLLTGRRKNMQKHSKNGFTHKCSYQFSSFALFFSSHSPSIVLNVIRPNFISTLKKVEDGIYPPFQKITIWVASEIQ